MISVTPSVPVLEEVQEARSFDVGHDDVSKEYFPEIVHLADLKTHIGTGVFRPASTTYKVRSYIFYRDVVLAFYFSRRLFFDPSVPESVRCYNRQPRGLFLER